MVNSKKKEENELSQIHPLKFSIPIGFVLLLTTPRMNIKRLQILVITFLFAFTLKAQTGEIYGVLKNIEGDSLPMAFLSLFKGGDQINATYSDFNGFYTFPGLEPGKYDVSVESVGLQSQIIKGVLVGTNQKVEVDFSLLPSINAVDIVEIIRYKVPLIDKDKQAKIYTTEDIEDLAARSVSEIIRINTLKKEYQ